MRRMTKLVLIGAFVFAAGCGKGGMDGKLDELAKIKDAMCACTDKACTEKQHEAYISWKKGNSKDDKPSGDQMKRYEELRTAMNDCRHKLEKGDDAKKPDADKKPE
jgi:hypothetical protein